MAKLGGYSHEGNKRGDSYDFLKILQAKFNKNEWNIYDTGENIDEVEQKSLLTTCTTRLHSYLGLPYIFWIFTKKISKNSTHLLYYLCESKILAEG